MYLVLTVVLCQTMLHTCLAQLGLEHHCLRRAEAAAAAAALPLPPGRRLPGGQARASGSLGQARAVLLVLTEPNLAAGSPSEPLSGSAGPGAPHWARVRPVRPGGHCHGGTYQTAGRGRSSHLIRSDRALAQASAQPSGATVTVGAGRVPSRVATAGGASPTCCRVRARWQRPSKRNIWTLAKRSF